MGSAAAFAAAARATAPGDALRFTLLLFCALCTALMVTLLPGARGRSIHGSYIQAYDTTTRRQLARVSLGDAHKNGVAHWATWVLIIDFSKDLIVVQKRRKDGVLCPGAYGLAGEHLEAGESVGHAAIRGLWEELSIKAHVQDLLLLDNFVFSHTYSNGLLDRNQNSTVYLYPWDAATTAVAESNDEASAVETLPLRTFYNWCQSAPDAVCGQTFARAYMKYIRMACAEAMASGLASPSQFCATEFPPQLAPKGSKRESQKQGRKN
eukprot:TRINITY_DN20237_c0_g1_i1.p2 TRINITY_DN20237_c0_g1~~TRINITY_DN20237_c0_g1_i1.p2  ORF type:complete len:266 (+),score=75.03 TRINITY_DN20237_c0_g1_i1:72-869(+)